MKCSQCDKPALYAVGEPEVPLCLACYHTHSQIVQAELATMERHLNYLSDEMAMIAGLPPAGPRYPERRVVQMTGGVTFNNIRMDRSTIGVLNTGSIGSIRDVDNAITILKQGDNPALGIAVEGLTEAVATNRELQREEKDQILEALSVLTKDAAAPKANRKPTVARTLLTHLDELIKRVPALLALWGIAKSLFEAAYQ